MIKPIITPDIVITEKFNINNGFDNCLFIFSLFISFNDVEHKYIEPNVNPIEIMCL